MKLYPLMIAVLLTGCNSGSESENAPVNNAVIRDPVEIEITEQVETVIPSVPMIPLIPVTPTHKAPVFIPDGITTITRDPYSGKIYRGGDVYLNYDSEINHFNNFELPNFKVKYRFEPLLEIKISNGADELCIRYSWKTKKYGMAKINCLWSNVSDGMELPDLHQAYYGYRVTGTRVWFNGVVGEAVNVN